MSRMKTRNRPFRTLALPLLILLAACGGGTAAPAATAPAPDTLRAFDYDSRAPLDVQVESTEKRDGVTLQKLTYASPRGGRVPAALIVPDGPGPFAGMLFLHGAPGTFDRMIPEAETLARRGTVALLINAPFARIEGGSPVHFDRRDYDHQVQLIVDLRRGVDLLLARPDVDPKRLGYLGRSFGGATGGLLAGVEKRISAYVLVVGDGGPVSHVNGANDADGPLHHMPKERAQSWLALMEPIESIRFVGRAAPAHLLFQNGRQDEMVAPADARVYQEAASEPKTILWYDAGHKLNDQAVYDRHLWLAERLGIAKPR
jgi:dienelactone hydrolase